MKMALRRRVSVKLVAQREEVLTPMQPHATACAQAAPPCAAAPRVGPGCRPTHPGCRPHVCQVLALVQHINEAALADTAAAVGALKSIESRADDLGLPLSGEAWGERLAIPKKGGGMHFDPPHQQAATAAFRRAGAMLTAATWREQLTGRASQCAASVSLFRGSSGRGAALSKGQM